ncbi:hypothetical protein [Chitinophaga sp. MM2321]|uniref:hypothetical protein n=1 Tax=Chitinophaga sp. MM2321 TaxID=3137178 RepID=UPI0032D59D20
MKRIALIALIAGVVMAAAARITELNDLPGAVELRTPGFIGYILIISSAAYFSLHFLFEWSKKAETYRS